MSDSSLVLSEVRQKVGYVTLNRAERNNALSLSLLRALNAELERLDGDAAVSVIVLAAAGKMFCEGADLAEMGALGGLAEIQKADYLTGDFEYIGTVRKPVIAAVQGYALGGGCELALMCDMIVAADNARFGFPEIKSGLMPGGGGTQRLIRLVGRQRAMELCLTGRTFRASEAERLGLVNLVTTKAELIERAGALADSMAQYELSALLAIKQASKASEELSLSDGLRAERALFHTLLGEYNERRRRE